MSLAILLPTFNGEKFISDQIKSIQNQRYQDFDLLVSDDGSTDDTPRIIQQFAAADSRIKVVYKPGNIGQKNRLLLLLEQTRSDFIAFADQDDVWDHEKLGLLLDQIGNHSIAFGTSTLIDEKGMRLGKSIFDVLKREPNTSECLRLLFEPLISAHSMIIRRNHVSSAAFYRTMAFDWLLSLEASFGSGIVYVQNAYTAHRLHRNNQWNKSFNHVKKYEMSKYPKPRLIRRNGMQDRYYFCNVIDYLSNSNALEPNIRRAFSEVLRHCEGSWFHDRKKAFNFSDMVLRQQILQTLLPLSKSANDHVFFSRAVRVLTCHWR